MCVCVPGNPTRAGGKEAGGKEAGGKVVTLRANNPTRAGGKEGEGVEGPIRNFRK